MKKLQLLKKVKQWESKPNNRLKRGQKSTKSKNISWEPAVDIYARILHLIHTADLAWIKQVNIKCFRSANAQTRAYARIWGLSRIWQLALKEKPMYIIEVISEKFDHLPQKEKDRILLHELAHIPKSASGALLPHTRRGKGSFQNKLKNMIKTYEMT